MLTTLSMSLKTNLVFPQDVGPTTMPVNGCSNVRLMTTTDLCRACVSLFIPIEEEETHNVILQIFKKKFKCSLDMFIYATNNVRTLTYVHHHPKCIACHWQRIDTIFWFQLYWWRDLSIWKPEICRWILSWHFAKHWDNFRDAYASLHNVSGSVSLFSATFYHTADCTFWPIRPTNSVSGSEPVSLLNFPRTRWLAVESHTRTVVRKCCKGDEASQWRNPKFDLRHAQTL